MTELERKTREFRTSAWINTFVHKSRLGDKYSRTMIDLYNRRFENKEVNYGWVKKIM